MGGPEDAFVVLSPVGSLDSPYCEGGSCVSDVSMMSRSTSVNSRASSGEAFSPSSFHNVRPPSTVPENAEMESSPTRTRPAVAVLEGSADSVSADSPTSPTGSAGSSGSASSFPARNMPPAAREVVFDLDDAAFSSDYFRMYEFKVCMPAYPSGGRPELLFSSVYPSGS
jgi:hypothetical protein